MIPAGGFGTGAVPRAARGRRGWPGPEPTPPGFRQTRDLTGRTPWPESSWLSRRNRAPQRRPLDLPAARHRAPRRWHSRARRARRAAPRSGAPASPAAARVPAGRSAQRDARSTSVRATSRCGVRGPSRGWRARVPADGSARAGRPSFEIHRRELRQRDRDIRVVRAAYARIDATARDCSAARWHSRQGWHRQAPGQWRSRPTRATDRIGLRRCSAPAENVVGPPNSPPD